MEDANTEDKKRKAIHSRIPPELLTAQALVGPVGVARELKWRCEKALNIESPDRATVGHDKKEETGRKSRKRNADSMSASVEAKSGGIVFAPTAKLKNYKPE